MFSSVKSSGADEAENVAVGNLCRRFLSRVVDTIVAPFFRCNAAGAVKRCEGRRFGVGKRVWRW